MKKITLLVFFLIGLGQNYAQLDCSDGDCQNIPVLADGSGWSASHGSPNVQTDHDNAVVMWSMDYSESNIGLQGEGLNYSGFNFIKGRKYCISYTLESETIDDQNIPVNTALMNVLLTLKAVKGEPKEQGGAPIPPTPEQSKEIMSTDIWNQATNKITYQEIITADNDYENIWFYPKITGVQSIQINALLHDLVICDITCPSDEELSFFFQDENGNPEDTFDLCENVTINAIANTQNFPLSVEISKVNSDNTLTFLSKRDNSDKVFDITDYFTNTSINPVIFEANTSYEVKIALDRGECGIAYGSERFTYNSGSISTKFTAHYDCHDNIFDATVIADDNNLDNTWKLFETSNQGSTADADTIGLVVEILDTKEHTFTNLNPQKYYYISHTSTGTTNCLTVETRIALVPCCISIPQIFAYCDDPCALDFFPLKVKDQNGTILTALSGYTFQWTNANTGTTSTNDIVMATSADIWSLTLSLPEYDCLYELEYSISCCDEGIQLETYQCPTTGDITALTQQLENLKSSKNNSEYQNHIMHTKSFATNNRLATAQCDPCTDGLFIIKVVDDLGNLVTDYNTITWSDGLYANQNIRWGTVNKEYKASIITNSSNGLDTCTYEDTIIYECKDADECENIAAPTNLKANGTILSWDPVPGAVSYIVSPASQEDGLSCCDASSSSFTSIPVNTNSLELPSSIANKCFSWKVVAVCSDASISAASSPSCYIPEIDELPTCNLPAPTNLFSTGNRLMWKSVPGAKGYIVRPATRFNNCCSVPQIELFASPTFDNYLYLDPIFRNHCFSWEVVAICSNDVISSLYSEPACYIGNQGDIGWELRNTENTKESISIFPNPNNGNMNIQVNSGTSLKIFRLNGRLMRSIKKMNTTNTLYNLQSDLPKGVYIFQFSAKNGTTSKQVIVE